MSFPIKTTCSTTTGGGKCGGASGELQGLGGVASRRAATHRAETPTERAEPLAVCQLLGISQGRGALWEMKSRGLRLRFSTLRPPHPYPWVARAHARMHARTWRRARARGAATEGFEWGSFWKRGDGCGVKGKRVVGCRSTHVRVTGAGTHP